MESKYYLIGFEFNNHWKPATIYAGETTDGDLLEVDEIESGELYNSEAQAESVRKQLQNYFPDLTWYLLKRNN